MEQGSVESYAVILPVKPPAFGKSRLRGLDDLLRRELAVAFALDTAAACLACERISEVLVATDDAGLAARLSALGCASVPDGTTQGLNAALLQAAAEAQRRWPTLTPAALLADLPALTPNDLDTALGSVARDQPSFVADEAGTGTTLYTAPYVEFSPSFGAESARAHELDGARALTGALTTLRHDVDDLDALWAALRLGVGPATAAVAGRLPAP
ncbi:MAG: 2-phospho-L-lactate guanylyltransferase [Nocardioides sp.]